MRLIAYGEVLMGSTGGSTQIVHVVDDDEAVRDSLRFLLEGAGLAVRTYAAAAALLDTDLDAGGCVLTDFRMPGMDGLQLQAHLAERGSALPVIVMTAHAEVPAAVRAMKAGAMDFLEKPCDPDRLIAAVRQSLEASERRRAGLARIAEAAGRIAGLTPREREVFDRLAAGDSTKEIARILGASPRTIEVHRARVFHKLNIETLPELVHLAIDAGLA